MKKIIVVSFGLAASIAWSGTAYRPVLLDFAKSSELSVAKYAGTETLTNFPLLVRISSERIPGFSYADCKSSDGRDIAFMDPDGKLLDHEVDTWDPAGTSFVWVRVPEFSSVTKIRFCWGNDDLTYDGNPKSVWQDYVGVWHFNETGDGVRKVYDATANGLDGWAHTNTAAVADGQIGGAQTMHSSASATSQGGVQVPYGTALDVQDFTVSYWERRNDYPYYRPMVSRRDGQYSRGWQIAWTSWGDANWVGMTMDRISDNDVTATPETSVGSEGTGKWDKYAFAVSCTNVTVYRPYDSWNKAMIKKVRHAKAPVFLPACGLGIGVRAATASEARNVFASGEAFCGDLDELRIYRGVLSETRIKAEGDNERIADFLTAATAVDRDPDAPAPGVPVLTRRANGDVVLSVALSGKAKSVKVRYGESIEKTLGTDVTGPVTLTDDPVVLPSGSDYSVTVTATDADDNTVTRRCGDTILAGNVSIQAGNDAKGLGLQSGGFAVTRPAEATNEALVVSYTASGATAGTDYETLPGTVTIPAGAASAAIVVKPLANVAKTLTLTLVTNETGPQYDLGTASASIALEAYVAGENTWCAAEDGNASVAANWSLNRVPREGDTIVLDGTSVKAMTWDAGVNGLPAAVAGWRQTSDYTGTVTIPTTYAAYDSAFTKFTVYGDLVLNGGAWTHPANDDTEAYRLRVDVSGDVTIGANAKINCNQKGYAQGKFHPGSRLGAHGGANDSHAYVYGDYREPVDLGSGGEGTSSRNGAGGGAVYLTVAGTVSCEGQILVGAASAVYGIPWHNENMKGGAGGSIFIRAASMHMNGKTTGALTATGSYGAYGDGGAGGRIAVVLTEQKSALDFVAGNTWYAKAGGTGGLNNPGCGTIFVKTAGTPNGILYLYDSLNENGFCNMMIDGPAVSGGCTVPPGETWTLDGIVFLGSAAHLAVPAGTTLNLPNGWSSVRNAAYHSYLSSARYGGGISYQGGTLNVPQNPSGKHVFARAWTLEALSPYTIAGDVEVMNGARLGTLCHRATTSSYPYSQLTVDGDLFVWGPVDSTTRGAVSADGAGFSQDSDFAARYSAHGGQRGAQQDMIAYDSVFHPSVPGASAGGTHGSGALKLTVTGTLNLDGTAEANAVPGYYGNWNPDAAAGSLDITCARLTGTGLVSANGNRAGTPSSGSSYHRKAAGAAGRVAVRLTDPDATFETFGVTNIQARGWHAGAATILDVAQSNYYVSAGTVYLEDANTSVKAGTVYIRDLADPDGCNTYSFTPFPSVDFGGENEDFTAATIDISSYARVKASRAFAANALTISDHATLDLNGQKLSVQTLTVDGATLAPGIYRLAQLAELGITAFKDTSASGRGRIKVGELGFSIFIR